MRCMPKLLLRTAYKRTTEARAMNPSVAKAVTQIAAKAVIQIAAKAASARRVNVASAVRVTAMAVTAVNAVLSALSQARKAQRKASFLSKISLYPLWNLPGVLLNL